MRYMLIMLLYAGGSLLGLTSPAFASCLYFWNNIFQPLEFARYPGVIPSAQIVFLVLVLSVAGAVFRNKVKLRATVFVWTSLMFLFWLMVSTIVSPWPIAREGFTLILKYMLPLYLVATSVQKFKDIEIVTGMLMASVGVWSSQGGVKGLLSGVTSGMMIPGGQMTDNNDFMVGTVAAIPIMVYFMLNYSGRFKIPVRASWRRQRP
jgi:hypothetical protein